MKTITKSELIDLLSKIKGTTFVSIETKTVPKLKSNPFTRLEKVSKVAGAIGFIYENSVNNQREKEGLNKDFKAKPRKWGVKIPHTPLVKNKDKYYLEMKVQNSSSDYFENNQRIPLDKVVPYMYTGSSRQNVSKEVILRDYLIDNITRIKLNKEEYNVV